MSDINKIRYYFIKRIRELEQYSEDETPWIFLCGSSFIEYLGKLTGNDFISFIKKYLSEVNKLYKEFKYLNGRQDLPKQMYYILRNGIIHRFSLFPIKSNTGRRRSIVLAHKSSGKKHLHNYHSNKIDDACIFIAEEFINDIKKAIQLIFSNAQTNKNLMKQIIKHYTIYPPISGGF